MPYENFNFSAVVQVGGEEGTGFDANDFLIGTAHLSTWHATLKFQWEESIDLFEPAATVWLQRLGYGWCVVGTSSRETSESVLMLLSMELVLAEVPEATIILGVFKMLSS